MIKLSESQLTVLSDACKRDNRCVFPVTRKLKGNAAGNVLKSLLAKGLLEEVPGQADDTVWRQTDEGPLTLRATDAAPAALNIGPDTIAPAGDAAEAPKPEKQARAAAKKSRPAADKPAKTKKTTNPSRKKVPAKTPRASRENSKQALLIEMLKRAKGASIDEIVEAFDWQPHTVRGVIAGALKKKLGLEVTSERDEKRGRVYRIVS